MKYIRLSFLFLLTTGTLFAQNKLTNSRTSGAFTYVYRLTDHEAYAIAINPPEGVSDELMHSPVDSFLYQNKHLARPLPYGNYLYVHPAANRLDYEVVPVSNTYVYFQKNGMDFRCAVADTAGHLTSGAEVYIGRRRQAKYDPESQLYRSGYFSKEKVITVKYQGVSNFFRYNIQLKRPSVKRRSFLGRLFSRSPNKTKKSREEKAREKLLARYKGYMVFSKPKYKPLDTVKFKTYLTTAKGESISNIPMRIVLSRYFNGNHANSTVLDTIKPYYEGGYAWAFPLMDSLKLSLDRNYRVSLEEKIHGEWVEAIGDNFRYEDYELQSLKFSARLDRTLHGRGDTVNLFLKATDENELAVPDGKVDILLKAAAIERYSGKLFIKDTLWHSTIMMDPVGETKVVLPDSLFPAADIACSIQIDFSNSNNETRSQHLALRHQEDNRSVSWSFDRDSIYVNYKVAGKSTSRKATLYTMYSELQYPGDDHVRRIDSVRLQLPFRIKPDPRAHHYKLEVEDGYEKQIIMSDLQDGLMTYATQNKDSLRIVVRNPHLIPFWYTVFSEKNVLLNGYTTQLDTLVRHPGTKVAHILISHVWSGHMWSREVSAAYSARQLQVSLLTPEMVYPGQTVDMQVRVTDADNQPAPATDVTTLAFTSKFNTSGNVSVPSFDKHFFARKRKPAGADKSLSDEKGYMRLNWQRWGAALHLDTIEYYKFTHTPDKYLIREATSETKKAIVAPFVVKDGNIETVHVVYIDGVPVYFSQAEQLKRYAFTLDSGMHDISLRTAKMLITLKAQRFNAGKKTIISVAADLRNVMADVVEMPNELTQKEAEQLDQYMIRITNNFGSEMSTISAGDNQMLLNPPPLNLREREMLIGPIRENLLYFHSDRVNQNFIKEPGYTYTFRYDLLKQKSFKSAYAFHPNLLYGKPITSFREDPLQPGEIDSIWNDYLNLRSRTTYMFNAVNSDWHTPDLCRLYMHQDSLLLKSKSYIKNIILYNPDQPDYIQILPGISNGQFRLSCGFYEVFYLLNDNSYFIQKEIEVKPYGYNCYEWSDAVFHPADRVSTEIDRLIKSTGSAWGPLEGMQKVIETLNGLTFNPQSFTREITGRVLDRNSGKGIEGAIIYVKGIANPLAVTDSKGDYRMMGPERGMLSFFAEGYDIEQSGLPLSDKTIYLLKTTAGALEEVVVRGYQRQTREQTTGSSYVVSGKTVEDAKFAPSFAAGMRGSVNISGLSTLNDGSAGSPLVFLDGLPFSGDVKSLDQNTIAEIRILKSDEAMSIYGARGANGVILIRRNKSILPAAAESDETSPARSMRRNFSDVAIWQPKLLTDAAGKASFKVKFPDDITSWNASTIAMNGRGQSGQTQLSIKSFKMLSANFTAPQFAVSGDRISVIGKLMDYSNTEETVKRTLVYNGEELLNSGLKFTNAHIDTVSILAEGAAVSADSLIFEYTMEQSNGYFDGEQRRIPLFQAGVKQTKGYFNVLSGDTSVSYNFDVNLGKVTLNAEASVFPVFISEIEKLRQYEYLCNEQLASKLKGFLLEKKIRAYLGEAFEGEKNIADILKRLQENRRPEGTWGWWNGSGEEMWISLHVVEALLEAKKEGYPVQLNQDQLFRYLLGRLGDRKKIDQLYLMKLLAQLDRNYYLKDWIEEVEKQADSLEVSTRREKEINPRKSLYHQPLYEKLQLAVLRQQAGMPVDISWLLNQRKSTMFGNHYWGEANNSFWDNSVQNTLLAYQILKGQGGYSQQLNKIARYFLEQRKDGNWRNTYESALILETIVPDLLVKDQKPAPPSLTINDTEVVRNFPFTKVITPGPLALNQKGSSAIYFTAYQQFQNPNPEKVSKDFHVTSTFIQNNQEVKVLKGGQRVNLQVLVEVLADADYVMIEIPIPAGCSYGSRDQGYRGAETHREYFKNKTSIFCTKLRKGKYTFNVELMPRYSGRYHLNPAKAEMMYFPVFYGREGMKEVSIK